MNERLRALMARRQQAIEAAKAISTKAGGENRDLTAEERAQFDAKMAEVTALDADIGRERALIEAERNAPPVPGAATPAGAGARVYANLLDDPRLGFQSYGQFACDVLRAGRPGGQVSERLTAMQAAIRTMFQAAAPTTYGSEGSTQDGGFMVPPEYSREIFQHSLEEDSLLTLTDDYPVQGNSLTFPRDETTPWGTDGIRAYWEIEAALATATKPKGTLATLRTNKLFALVPVTDELAEDAAALSAYIGRKTSESIRWKANLAIFQGTGAGMPLGFFGHASQVSVAKEAAQAADTIVAANLTKMYGRCINIRNAIWMINHDAFHQLPLITIGNQPVFTAPNEGIKAAPNGLLLGRPIMITQLCKTVGDKGDIVLANLKYYRTISKAAGIQTAVSMHLYFDSGATAFRATLRLDGQPQLAGPVNPANGANTLAPFVTVDDRA